MSDANPIDQIMAALRGAMPQDFVADSERKLRAVLNSVFERLDLVTREELDVQAAVLSRTRAKLTDLEKRIAELEQRLSGS
ncbi:MAG: accessory factor UbiK family protein [Gammaproteobacteria bacterium]|nr:accessory factor UbiK family protein [Gammaproteobacteria bacterium]